jgi:hypothetical protein
MKQLGKEMKHLGHPSHPTPPAPPPPPTAPWSDQELRDHEQRMRDQEQRMRDQEQRMRDREQRARDAEAAMIFTSGPAGVDYRRDTAPVTTVEPAQPTEPVAPPTSFTEEPAMTEQEPIAQAETAPDQPIARSDQADPRLRVLEALEKGEIDIEDALAQLEAERNGDTTQH